VAAVEAAVAAGREAAEKVGIVLSSLVIPRPHDEVARMIEVFKTQKANKEEQ
jgi:microcompartment protein CcmL/EutN